MSINRKLGFGGIGTRLAHSSIPVGLGNKDLRALQDHITAEKGWLLSNQNTAQQITKTAETLRAWGAGEGDDLKDILGNAGVLLDHLSSATVALTTHQTRIRELFKKIRTREEELDDLRRRRKTLGGKMDAAEKKLAKMNSENKNLPQQTQLLEGYRQQAADLDTQILNEEARIWDFKRSTTKHALALKFCGLIEWAEKAAIVGEMGKLLIEEIPLDTAPPSYPHPSYHGYERSAKVVSNTEKTLSEVTFGPMPVTDLHAPSMPTHEDFEPPRSPTIGRDPYAQMSISPTLSQGPTSPWIDADTTGQPGYYSDPYNDGQGGYPSLSAVAAAPTADAPSAPATHQRQPSASSVPIAAPASPPPTSTLAALSSPDQPWRISNNPDAYPEHDPRHEALVSSHTPSPTTPAPPAERREDSTFSDIPVAAISYDPPAGPPPDWTPQANHQAQDRSFDAEDAYGGTVPESPERRRETEELRPAVSTTAPASHTDDSYHPSAFPPHPSLAESQQASYVTAPAASPAPPASRTPTPPPPFPEPSAAPYHAQESSLPNPYDDRIPSPPPPTAHDEVRVPPTDREPSPLPLPIRPSSPYGAPRVPRATSPVPSFGSAGSFRPESGSRTISAAAFRRGRPSAGGGSVPLPSTPDSGAGSGTAPLKIRKSATPLSPGAGEEACGTSPGGYGNGGYATRLD